MQEFRVSVNDKGEIVDKKPIGTKFTDSFDSETGYRFQRSKTGSTQYDCRPFPEELSYADIGKVTLIARDYLLSDNLLGQKKNSRIYAFTTVTEICKSIGISSKTQGHNFMRKMFDCGVIKKVNGYFYMNPCYFIKNCERLSFKMFAMFYMDLRVLLPAALYRQMFSVCMSKKLLTHDDYEKAKALMR